MIKAANISIRTYLLAGFIATAAMTLLAGLTGVLSLSRIQGAVVGSAATVREHVEDQSAQLRYTLSVEQLRDNIQVARSSADMDRVKSQFNQLADVNSKFSDELKVTFRRLIDLKKEEVVLSQQLGELTHTLETHFNELHRKISALTNNAASGAPSAVQGAVVKSQPTAEEGADTDADGQTTVNHVKTSLTIGMLGRELDVLYKDVLLSSEPAEVDTAEKIVEGVYANLSDELASLPVHHVGPWKRLINDMQTVWARLFQTRRTLLTVQIDRAQTNESVAAYIRAFNNGALINAEQIGDNIGSILAKVTDFAHRYSVILLVASLAAFAIAVLVGFFVPRTIGTHITHITEGVDVISRGNLTRELSGNGRNEFGRLALGFNGMVRHLRDILAKIQDAAGQITSSSAKILAASEQQAAGTREQSAAVSQTTSAASELSKTSEQIGNNVKAVSKMAAHVLTGMHNIREATHQTNDILTSLNDKSKQIGEITELIDDIADQTNLLAVNASIEAARAGDHGRGFTVVADQIGKLADSTAKSTKDITALIELIQNEMSNAIIAMEQSLKGVESEIGLAQEAADKAQEIAMSANQQISGSKQIAEAMNNIDDTMKQIASSAQMSAASVKELTALADELKDSIKGFKVTENAV